ncbi:MAG: regulatory protein RecX [Patescibacteria group bacterium]
MRFLSFRPRSEREVRDYLIKASRKKASAIRHSGEEDRWNGGDSGHGQNDGIESVIEKVIEKLKAQNLINDEEFAKWWIESRTTFKPRSLRLIKIELRQKGIDSETIDSLQLTVNNDLEQAKKLVEKRIGRFRGKFGMTREEIYQKMGRHLASKGFDWDIIKKSIDYVYETM